MLVEGGGNEFLRNKSRGSGTFDLGDYSDGSNTYDKDKFKTVDPLGNQP